MPSDPAEVLRSRGLRVTPQRRAILGAFSDRAEEHLSADEVHALASATIAELGRGTVYATLAELTELGVLGALGSPEPVRYEINTQPHQHFRCRLCLRLYDVELPAPPTAALERAGFTVDGVAVVAEGVCAACGAYGRGLTDGVAAIHDDRQVSDEVTSTLACARHETSLGPVLMAASGDGMVRIAFEEHADFDAFSERAATRRGGKDARGRLDVSRRAIDAYLAGDQTPSDEVVDWAGVEPGDRAALEATRRIPWGELRSYHRLGTDLGPYECGYVMGTNPMPFLFPCHRVTRGSEIPDAYLGGGERRRRLLELER